MTHEPADGITGARTIRRLKAILSGRSPEGLAVLQTKALEAIADHYPAESDLGRFVRAALEGASLPAFPGDFEAWDPADQISDEAIGRIIERVRQEEARYPARIVQGDTLGEPTRGEAVGRTIYEANATIPALGPDDQGDMRILTSGGMEAWSGTDWVTVGPRIQSDTPSEPIYDEVAFAGRLAAALALVLTDAHPTYSSTAKWHGGIGGQAITSHCSITQGAPPGGEWAEYGLPSKPLRQWLAAHQDFDLDAAKEAMKAELLAELDASGITRDGLVDEQDDDE